MALENVSVPRRTLLTIATTVLAACSIMLAAATVAQSSDATDTPGNVLRHEGTVNPSLVRIASVPTSVEGGLLPFLVDIFTSETGLKVIITADNDPYDPAKMGKFDLVISHFGHRDVKNFVLKGFGSWPQTVFSNQLCLFGPPSDPAKVRGMSDLVRAFRRIADAKAPYVVNETKGIEYLTEILWNAAGKPSKGSWFIDPGINKNEAILLAAKRKGYVIWGLTPFLREQKEAQGGLVPLVTADPMLQRIMVSVVVNPENVQGVNASGAEKFQRFLLLPSTQAKIRKFHYPGVKGAVWAPAGRHNAGSILPEQ